MVKRFLFLAVALMALLPFARADSDSPVVRPFGNPVSIAPQPREKHDPCLCPDDDMRCRARAALALHAVAKSIPQVMPSAERIAARAALQQADKAIKAAPKPVPR